MAILQGVLQALAAAPSSTNMLGRGLMGSKLRVMVDSYEAAGTTAGDIVKIGKKLNAGDRIIALIIACDDLGTGVTMDGGYANASDTMVTSLFDGLDVATAALKGTVIIEAGSVIDVSSSGSPDAPYVDSGMGYKVGTATGDDQVAISLEDAAATGTIKVAVIYAVA